MSDLETLGTGEIQTKWVEAKYLAQADILPKHFAGKPGNILVALEYAKQLSNSKRGQISPIAIMQNLFVVHGNCGLTSKFMIALANSSGKLDENLKWEVDKSENNNLKVTCFGLMKGKRIEFRVDMKMAEAEGWTKNSKYRTMPELMLKYRSATFLIRTFMPEVVMGLQTEEDVIDVEYQETINTVGTDVKKITPVTISDKANIEETAKTELVKDHVGFASLKKKVDEMELNNDLNKIAKGEWSELSIARFNGLFRYVMDKEKHETQ